MSARRYGAVLFETPALFAGGDNTQNSGWACVDGQDPIPVRGTGDLATGVYWLTNLNCKLCWEVGLHETPHILSDDYLGCRSEVILTELGCNSLSIQERARVLSSVFSRVCRLGHMIYDVTPQRYGYSWGLAQVLAEAYQAEDASFSQACSGPSSFSVLNLKHFTAEEGRIPVLFTRPRYQHAVDVLSAGIPSGAFRQVSERNLPPPSERVAWLLKRNKAALAEIEVSHVSRRDWQLFVGSRGQRFTDGNPSDVLNHIKCFVTSMELEYLKSVADVYVKSAWINKDILQAPRSLPVTSKIYQLSYSYGLLLENVWRASTRTSGGERPATPKSAWIQSRDRCLLLSMCLKLRGVAPEVEFPFIGSGQMVAHVAESELAQLVCKALQIGLIPYAGGDLSWAFDQVLRLNDPLVKAWAGWSISSSPDEIFDIDGQVIKEAMDCDEWRATATD